MCGRFAQSKLDDALIEEFGITGAMPESVLPANWNIAPSREIYVVRDNLLTRERDLTTASWGMIGPWYKDLASARAAQSHAINARSESVFEKPTFREPFRKRRCLIPASGYYEWATALGPYKTKQPFYISRQDGGSLALAGIWSEWVSAKGEILTTAAIITHEASGRLAEIHNRRPVFMPPEYWQGWLDPQQKEISELIPMMEYSQGLEGLTAHAVSTEVNSVRNNRSELIAPLALGEPETLF